MLWVQKMNSSHSRAEEFIMREYVCGGFAEWRKYLYFYSHCHWRRVQSRQMLHPFRYRYAYGELTPIANNAIYQYRDMYLRPNFYIENEKKVRDIIAEVITQYANGEIDHAKAELNAWVKLYQFVNPTFNPDEEFAKDTCYRDIPPIDNGMFTIARKLLLEIKWFYHIISYHIKMPAADFNICNGHKSLSTNLIV